MTEPTQTNSIDQPNGGAADHGGQAAPGPQTTITGDVQGPVLSGEFNAPVHVGDVIVPPATPSRVWMWVGVSAGAVVVIAVLAIWIAFTNGTPPAGTAVVAATTPAPTPSPTPDLQVLAATTLQGRHLSDVAAANGHAWFATDQGLLHSAAGGTAGPQPIAHVPHPLSALAVEESGEVVWFSRGDATLDEGPIGRYTLRDDRVDWFTPPTENAFQDITAIQIGRSGEIWFGNAYGVTARLSVNGAQAEWTFPTPSADLKPISHVYDLAVDPRDRGVVWAVGSQALYRWRDERWDMIDRSQTGGSAESEAVNAIAIDSASRVWLGHSEGVTLFADRQPGGIFSLPCPSGLVLDVAAGPTDTGVWLVTQTGLARIDTASPDSLNNCDTWQWSRWSDANFWADANAGDYRLAIDAQPSGALTVWIIQRGTDKARFLVWRP